MASPPAFAVERAKVESEVYENYGKILKNLSDISYIQSIPSCADAHVIFRYS